MSESRYDKARAIFVEAGAHTLWEDELEDSPGDRSQPCCMMAIYGELYFLQGHISKHVNEFHAFRHDTLGDGMTWDSVLAELKKRHPDPGAD